MRFGKTKWSGSQKSVEGSIGAWISMALSLELVKIAAKLLSYPGDFPSWKIWTSSAIVAIFEAQTDQIDNLYLPLILAGALNWKI